MTAGEDQPESVVGNRFGIAHVRNLVARAERGLVGERLGLSFCPTVAPETVDRAPPRRREEPGAGPIRRPGCGPAVERLLERFLDDLLGQIDVAHDPKHRRDDPRVLVAKRIRHARVSVGDRRLTVIVRGHGQRCYLMRRWSSPDAGRRRRPLRCGFTHIGQTGRMSIEPPSRSGIFFAHSMASDFESQSIT